MNNRFLFLLGALFVLHTARGQEAASFYEKCKQGVAEKAYAQAVHCFREYRFLHAGKSIRRDQRAQFYEGVALQGLNRPKRAEEVWLQLAADDAWKDKEALVFHLGKNFFLQEKLLEGARHFARLKNAPLREIGARIEHNSIVEAQNFQEVLRLYEDFPRNSIREKWMELLLEERLRDKQPLIPEALIRNMQATTIHKDAYRVALLLPLSHEDGQKDLVKNHAAVDIYRGVHMATQDADWGAKTPVTLHVYDTKESAEEVACILRNPALSEVDLMIGPLHHETVAVASTFSKNKKINMLHPVSINLELGAKNSYFFFAQASYLTQLEVLTRHVAERIERKETIVFYEDQYKDLIIAQTYAQKIQKAGFDVVILKGFSMQEADLLKEEMLATFAVPAEEAPPEEEVGEEEEQWMIPEETVGHIFLSASHPIFLANLMSAVEIRPDTIPIFTQDHFLSRGHFSLSKMEQLNVRFLSPFFVGNTEAKRRFTEDYIRKYATRPSGYALVSYETLYAWSLLFQEEGTYVQNAFWAGRKAKGRLSVGFHYGLFTDNQNAHILRINQGRVKVVE